MSLHRASTGAIVNLGQLLGRGGEGAVHAVVGAPKLVAKIYLKPPDAAKAEKLKLMIRGKSAGLLGVAAWPVDLLTDQRGAVRGFLMGRISARQDAHRLYSPKSRRGTFPDADFRFVVRASTNLARAFAQIHAAGHVIGDVNHGNALIGKDGTAVLIDCDSIQVNERGRIFTCDVGSPLFTPPELQGKVFRGLKRAESHDRFGLAVLIFHLLFQGRHPYAGVFAHGEMPLERAIAEWLFAYGANAASYGMSQPPGTLPLTTFGKRIAALFERAFAPLGPEERPSALEWIEALQALEHDLTVCPRRPRHFHPRGAHCCWCDIETRTGAKLFDDGQPATGDADAVTAEQLWQAIEGIEPPPPPELPKYAAEELTLITPSSSWAKVISGFLDRMPSLLMGAILAGSILGFSSGVSSALVFMGVLVGGSIAALAYCKRVGPSRVRRALRIEWQIAIAQWRNHSSAGLFKGARSQLEQARRSLIILREQEREELQRLERFLEPRQHKAFLDGFDIEKALFIEVTRANVVLLAARGVRSAGDVRRRAKEVSKILSLAGERELRAWVNQCAVNFKFDKRDPVFPDTRD